MEMHISREVDARENRLTDEPAYVKSSKSELKSFVYCLNSGKIISAC